MMKPPYRNLCTKKVLLLFNNTSIQSYNTKRIHFIRGTWYIRYVLYTFADAKIAQKIKNEKIRKQENKKNIQI